MEEKNENEEGTFMQVINIISSLESIMPFLSSKEKTLGEYVLMHRHEILSLTLKDLSLKAQISEATVIRFARKLGCEGYSDFKLSLSANLSAEYYNGNSDLILDKILPTDSSDSVLKKMGAFVITSVQSTIDIIDSTELDKAIKLIQETSLNHHNIYLSGMGASSTLVKQLQIKLMRLDIPVIYYEDVHLQLESNLNMVENDLLICFTTLGKSVQSHQFIDIANKKKAKIILITQFGNQELANKATVTLFGSAVENNLRLASHTALIVQSLIVDTLFLTLALKRLPEIQEGVAEKNRIFSELGYSANDFK